MQTDDVKINRISELEVALESAHKQVEEVSVRAVEFEKRADHLQRIVLRLQGEIDGHTQRREAEYTGALRGERFRADNAVEQALEFRDRALQLERLLLQEHAEAMTGDAVPPKSPVRPVRDAAEVVREGFDAEYYLAANPDVADSGMDPLLHFMLHGWIERRDPNAFFSIKSYLETNDDVARRNVNPFYHYLTSGLLGHDVSRAHDDVS
jgi:hypothetical protein